MKCIATLIASALVAAPAMAQDDEPYVTFQVLKPELAVSMAQAALTHCREAGYQVGVTVVDRFGNSQVFIRDRFAGAHTNEFSFRKAWTAASFRTGTSELNEISQPGTMMFGLRESNDAMLLGGGVPVLNGDGALIAGIGVSGAPGPDIDDECALAGIAAIEDDIAF